MLTWTSRLHIWEKKERVIRTSTRKPKRLANAAVFIILATLLALAISTLLAGTTACGSPTLSEGHDAVQEDGASSRLRPMQQREVEPITASPAEAADAASDRFTSHGHERTIAQEVVKEARSEPAAVAEEQVTRAESSAASHPASSSGSTQGAATGNSDSGTTAAPQERPRQRNRGLGRDTARSGGQPLVDPVSTFGLDVGRFSYKRALSPVNQGWKLDQGVVRGEDWINSVAYDYPHSCENSFNITAEVFRHPDTDGRHMAAIAVQGTPRGGIQAGDPDPGAGNSGSMAGQKLLMARQAAELIADAHLSQGGQISVVHFEYRDTSGHQVKHTEISFHEVMEFIHGMRAGGATNVQAGLDEGLRLAQQARRQNRDALNYVVPISETGWPTWNPPTP